MGGFQSCETEISDFDVDKVQSLKVAILDLARGCHYISKDYCIFVFNMINDDKAILDLPEPVSEAMLNKEVTLVIMPIVDDQLISPVLKVTVTSQNDTRGAEWTRESDECVLITIPHCWHAPSNFKQRGLPQVKRRGVKLSSWIPLPLESYAVTTDHVYIKHSVADDSLYGVFHPETRELTKGGDSLLKRILTFASYDNRLESPEICVTIYLVDDLPHKVQEVKRAAKKRNAGKSMGNGFSVHKMPIKCSGGAVCLTVTIQSQNNSWTTNGGTKQTIACSELGFGEVCTKTFSIHHNTTLNKDVTDNTLQWKIDLSQAEGVQTELTYTPTDINEIKADEREYHTDSAFTLTENNVISRKRFRRIAEVMRTLDQSVIDDMASMFGFLTAISPNNSELLLAEIVSGCSHENDLREFFDASPSFIPLTNALKGGEHF